MSFSSSSEDALRIHRQIGRSARRAVGVARSGAIVFEADAMSVARDAAIAALPCDTGSWQSLQVDDPDDLDYGQPYFDVWYSDPMGDDILR